MNSYGEKLKVARKAKNLSQEELAKLIGVSRNAITNYEKNNNTPTYENNKKLEEVLDVRFNDEQQDTTKVPVVGTASCGLPEICCYQEDNTFTLINNKDWNKNLFAVVACGDSMATEIYDGDICIIDPFISIRSGDIVYYKIDNESAVKIFVDDIENNLIHFVPFNSTDTFKTRTIRKDDEFAMRRLSYYKVEHIVSSKKNNRAARLKMIGR